MKLKYLVLILALLGASTAMAAEDATAKKITPQPVFTVQDCALWKGGEGYENDNVPAIYSQHVEAMLEFYDNLPLPEAMRAIETYCNKGGFK